MPDMADRLKIARERRGYATASDAARAMRIPVPTYSGHENGTTGFLRSAAKYARFFRCDLEWLITGRGTPDGDPISAIVRDIPEDKRPFVIEFLENLRDRAAQSR